MLPGEVIGRVRVTVENMRAGGVEAGEIRPQWAPLQVDKAVGGRQQIDEGNA